MADEDPLVNRDPIIDQFFQRIGISIDVITYYQLVTWPPRRLSIAKGKTIVAELQREQSGNRLFPCDFSLVERSRPHDPIQAKRPSPLENPLGLAVYTRRSISLK